MQIHRERQNSRPNYERIVDEALAILNEGKGRNHASKVVLEEVRDYLASSLVLKAIDYDKSISKPILRLLEKYPDFNESQALTYLESLLKYNQELTYRNQAIHAFTFLEAYFNPGKFDDYALDFRQFTSKRK